MAKLKLGLIALLSALSIGCGSDEQSTVGNEPVGSTMTGAGKSDVYGDDDRFDLDASEVTVAQARAAQATAMMITPSQINDILADGYRLNGTTHARKKQSEFGLPLCAEERFQDEPAPGFCSGFLIAPDLVATAGHCVGVKQACGQIKFAFGFHGADGTYVPKSDFYECRAVVGHLFDRERMGTITDLYDRELWSDWAVLQLDRPVVGRTPLELRATPVSAGESVAAIGHPGGVPTKVTQGNVVGDPLLVWFNTDLDIYRGNSGSLIADAQGRAVGIVSRGTGGASYTIDDARQCVASKRCDRVDNTSASCSGNQGIRIEPLAQFLDAVPVRKSWVGGFDQVISDNGTPRRLSFDIDADGYIHYVTLNATVRHNVPKSLEFALVAPDGARHVVLNGPVDWQGGLFTPSRTSFAFGASAPRGTWALEVRDTNPGDAAIQYLDWAQLVIGVGHQQPAVSTPAAWVGSACESDADCAFDHHGTPGQCFSTTTGGFCSIPCDGYCPDQDGFAWTFCADLGAGIGNCVATPAGSNGYCADVPGTTSAMRNRYVGNSTAPAATRDVCAP